MKVGDLIRWNHCGYDSYKSLKGSLLHPQFENQGIVIELDGKFIKPPVVTVMWDTNNFEKIYADELEVVK
jgi:hypothetical protein|tara:strand:- start:353 stop:562 length:210 start_codon:yes stop_codon:yes gene_type:complete